MITLRRRDLSFGLLGLGLLGSCSPATTPTNALSTQLNWLHDPTFVSHYRLADQHSAYSFNEGGPNIFPVGTVQSGTSAAAICGADIFLKAIAEAVDTGAEPDLAAIFIDFQRNPVGWVLHPQAARQLGIDIEAFASGEAAARSALIDQVRSGRLQVGDKVGTETTAILTTWRTRLALGDRARVVPVGFDSSVVMNAPALLFPVYLNEEPYRLAERIGSMPLIVDPVTDGIALYGNVVIARRSAVEERRADYAAYVQALREAWLWCRDHQDEATALVSRYYRGAAPGTVSQQVAKTVEFAFFDTASAGSMDLALGGRLDQTIQILKDGGALPPSSTFERAAEHFIDLSAA